MGKEDLFNREVGKGDAFRLLSEFFSPPNEEMVLKLKVLESRIKKACIPAVPYIAKMEKHFEDEGDIDSLRVDFSRLFVGPFGMLAPPYGSVYMESGRKVMGDSTLDVVSRYREEGLDISGDFHDAPDHIAVELEFVHFLIFKSLEAASHSDMHASGHYMEKRRRFYAEHLGAWISDFQEHVEEKAETNFYKNLARATRTLIQEDLEEISVYKVISG